MSRLCAFIEHMAALFVINGKAFTLRLKLVCLKAENGNEY